MKMRNIELNKFKVNNKNPTRMTSFFSLVAFDIFIAQSLVIVTAWSPYIFISSRNFLITALIAVLKKKSREQIPK